MTRKDFILNSIYKSTRITKIILYFSVVIYLIYFLKNSLFDENSTERQVSVLGLLVFGFLCLAWFVKYFLHTVWNNFPIKTQNLLNAFFKILEYLSIIFLIYYAYQNWNNNKLMVLLFGAIFLFSYTKNILKQTKQT